MLLPFVVLQEASAFTILPTSRNSSLLISQKIDQLQQQIFNFDRAIPLFAKSTKKKSNRATRNKMGKRTASSSGFGGAAIEPCPCGSDLGYMKCCGIIHKDPDVFAAAKPEQIVRARYSAYAKREVDFIIGSTHPLNENNFMTDIDHWRETIKTNCYDNFELTKCEIVSESFEGEGENQVGKVTFVATMIQADSREKTSFMETSTFERAGKHIRQGAWLYRDGKVEAVPGSENEQNLKVENDEEESKEEGEKTESTE